MKYFRVLLKIFSSFVFFVVHTCGAREHVHVVKQIEIIQGVCRFQMQSLQRRVQDAASTGSAMTGVIADTQGLSTRRVLIQGTNVQLHSLSDRTYQPEYCKNMLFPTLVIYVPMLVTFAPMAGTMNCTFITFLALNDT